MTLMSVFDSTVSMLKLFCYEDKNIVFDLENLTDYFIQSEYYLKLEQNLLDNWLNHNKFYFTIDFDGTDKIISSCSSLEAATNWIFNKNFLKFVLQKSNPTQRLNTIKTVWSFLESDKFKTMLREYA
jgi:hypothetical protein